METIVKEGQEGFAAGFLAGFLKQQQGADLIGLVNIMFGAELMNQGVLLEGLRMWKRVAKWGAPEIALARQVSDPERLVNAMAEQYFGAFGRGEEAALPALAVGAILGEKAAQVSSFYEEAGCFLTRVVGLRYEGRIECVEDLVAGEEVLLVWEQGNPVDPKALRVITQKGQSLGFIRKPIAHRLVHRVKAGTALRGKVALVLSEQYDINERVWVRVETEEADEKASHGASEIIKE